MQNNWNYRI